MSRNKKIHRLGIIHPSGYEPDRSSNFITLHLPMSPEHAIVH
ncbi:uncharacterized protein METZ01_LOCUS462556, partial [marine metagenome]